VQETSFSITITTPPFPEKLMLSLDQYPCFYVVRTLKRNYQRNFSCIRYKAQRFHFQMEFLPSQLRSSTPCVSDCKITEINVTCGWFRSVRLVNARVFRRLSYDNCLVKDGHPLAPRQTLSFLYANSFSYPLSVSSVSCF
ncbi:unnamed protein product, partial [Brassica rapa]